MKKTTVFLFAFSFLFVGCTNEISSLEFPSFVEKKQEKRMVYVKINPNKEEAFMKDFMEVAHKTKEDQKYQRIGLDTPENKQWFKNLSYMLWNRDINKREYVSEGLKKYPNHRYEFSFVANNL